MSNRSRPLPWQELPALAEQARSERPEVASWIDQWVTAGDLTPDRHLVGAATLTFLGREPVGFVDDLLGSDPSERLAISQMLVGESESLPEKLRVHLIDSERPAAERLAAAQALAVLSPLDVELATIIEADDILIDELIRQQMYSGEFIDDWTTSFEPVAELLIRKLAPTAFSPDRTPESVEATKLVLRWCRDNPKRTFDHLLDAQPWQETPEFLAAIQESVPENADRLRSLIDQTLSDLDSSPSPFSSDEQMRRAGHAVVLLAELGETDRLYDSLIRRRQPALRVEVIHRLAKSRVKTDRIGEFLAAVLSPDKPELATKIDAQAALLKVLSMRPRPSQQVRDAVFGRAQGTDSAEVHSSAILCLANWEELDQFELRTDQPKEADLRQWRINGAEQVMIRIETQPDDGPALHPKNSPLADFDLEFMATEVSIDDYLEFRPDDYINYDVSATNRHPANVVTFPEAVAYARWLTEQEELGEDQQCYPPIDDPDAGIPTGWQPYTNHRQRTGYRLPTMAELEFAIRGGIDASLRYSTGRDDRRMIDYAWGFDNSAEFAHLVVSRLPNRNGLFNTFGNIAEWSIDQQDIGQRYFETSSYLTSHRNMEFGLRKSTNEQTYWNQIGMRLVRSVPSR